ncbi:MAG: T9SS type A sorting domain-containing protein [Flavobacteriales bacterium]
MNKYLLASFAFVAAISCTLQLSAQQPLFPNSVVSNDIDFILSTDPAVFQSITFIGLEDKEMPDSQSEELFDEDTFIFEASFSTGQTLEIWCHSSFLTQPAAEEYALKLGPRLGKLPAIHREMLNHVVVHNGDATAFAETEGNFFVLYSDNMDDRISTNDLEETVFHEAIHASLQNDYGDSQEWLDAQDSDNAFITEYAEELPALEDMPETALFAYAYLVYPGRLSPEIEAWLDEHNPDKLAFFSQFYSTDLAVSERQSHAKFKVFPNPVRDKISIQLNHLSGRSVISILNVTGTEVKTISTKSETTLISLEELPSGVYLISVRGYEPLRILKQ